MHQKKAGKKQEVKSTSELASIVCYVCTWASYLFIDYISMRCYSVFLFFAKYKQIFRNRNKYTSDVIPTESPSLNYKSYKTTLKTKYQH